MMMSPDTIPSSKPTVTDPNQSSTCSGSRKSGASQKQPDHQQALKCPRCDSPNTKFCYYNNYSLTQPRHFCKTCRRYWTKGGALRNVPIGGGCRKNKKSKTGSRNSDDSCRDSLSGSTYDSSSGLKFFHGFTTAAAMEFQLGSRLPFARLNSSSPSVYNQFISFGGDLSSAGATTTTSPTCLNMDASPSSSSLMGFENYPSVLRQQGDHSSSNGGGGIMNWGVQEIGSSTNAAQYNSLASSIESLSCINQDLHWKLQQQRLAMLFGTGENKQLESCVSSVAAAGSISLLENQAQKTQPILFQNLDIPKPEAFAVVNPRKSGIDDDGPNNTSTTAEWFFENPNIPGATTPANSSNNGNEHTSNWSSGIQAWSDLHDQYSALPQ